MTTHRYQGLFITETILGNPNGSFVNNEPRNIDGKVFTTDKCIKFNIRAFIHNNYEDLEAMENFVFFYPRKIPESGLQPQYKTKEDVFKEYFNNDISKLYECPDVRMFGGTFSFRKNDQGNVFGPIQITFGLDLIGAEIKAIQLGTPFANETGKQKTLGEKYIVDHAVIAYDININPNTAIREDGSSLLRPQDVDLFQEAIVYGTNDRVSTSKASKSKLLIMIKFKEDFRKNIGELKALIEVKSPKINNTTGHQDLELDFAKVSQKLKLLSEHIEVVEIMKDINVIIHNFSASELGIVNDKFVIKTIGQE